MANQITVSVIIPVYNEEQILIPSLSYLISGLERRGLAFEVILAENGSTDATPALIAQVARDDSRIRVVQWPRPDYGQAMRQGFLSSAGKYLVNFSIDFAPLSFLDMALKCLEQYDLVLGSKYLRQADDRRPLLRRLGGRLLGSFVRCLFALPVADTHGLLAMRRDRLIPLIERCHFGHEIFDTELVVRCHRAGLALCEVPVQVTETRPSRQGAFRRAWRMLRQLFKLRQAFWREGIR